MVFLRLFWVFFKIGLFTIGGGHAMIPLIMQDVVAEGWISESVLIDFIAISESTPGPFAVNIATYTGTTVGEAFGGFWYGLLGALSATLGVVTPSIIIIILIVASILNQFRKSQYVQHAFYGLRPASTGLIVAAGLSVAELAFLNLEAWTGFSVNSLLAVIDWKAIVLAVAVYVGLVKFKKHPILYIAISALVGIIFKF